MGLFPPAPGGGAEVDHGYKGKGTLMHLVADYNGRPLAITTTSANGNERKEIPKLLDKITGIIEKKQLRGRALIIFEADKGYDSSSIRQMLLNRGLFPFIPRRRTGQTNISRPSNSEVSNFFNIKSVRWKVERAFAWLKRKYRRLLLRWERLSQVWSAFATLSLIHYWQIFLFR